MLFFFEFHRDGCKSSPRIARERVSPWHLSIVRTKIRKMGICSIETVKLQFGILMNTSCSNIGWMPIMLGESLGSKTWSWLSNFMKTVAGHVDETITMYPKLSSMTW
jgi:hypothetical protein